MQSLSRDYRNIHKWVGSHLGKPSTCEGCNKPNLKGRKIHWANLSGAYKHDTADWKRLCVSCHWALDKHSRRRWPEFCKNGHRQTVNNLYLKHGTKKGVPYRSILCRPCRNEYANSYYHSRLAAA